AASPCAGQRPSGTSTALLVAAIALPGLDARLRLLRAVQLQRAALVVLLLEPALLIATHVAAVASVGGDQFALAHACTSGGVGTGSDRARGDRAMSRGSGASPP